MNDTESYDQILSNDNLLDFDKKNKSISSSYIHKMQRKHFMLFNVIPPVATVILFFSLTYTNSLTIGKTEIYTAIILWGFSGLGITAGYHRLFTHRSYKASIWLKKFLHYGGLTAGQGTVVSWAAIHRQHHKFSDKKGDPHSPNLHKQGVINHVIGLIHSHFTWMIKHDYPNVLHYVPDLIRDSDIVRLDKKYILVFIIGVILPGIVSFLFQPSLGAFLSGILLGGLFRVILLGNTIWAINSFLHKFGSRPFHTRENSHNFGLISPLSFGECWHNNHHAFPGSAAFGLKWYELDFGFYFIKLMALFKCVTNIKTPSKSAIERSYKKHERS